MPEARIRSVRGGGRTEGVKMGVLGRWRTGGIGQSHPRIELGAARTLWPLHRIIAAAERDFEGAGVITDEYGHFAKCSTPALYFCVFSRLVLSYAYGYEF